MADAKICDRCGKFYLNEYSQKFKIVEKKNYTLRDVYKNFDLCNECYEDWIEDENGN